MWGYLPKVLWHGTAPPDWEGWTILMVRSLMLQVFSPAL